MVEPERRLAEAIAVAVAAAHAVASTEPSRENSLALTKLQEAGFWNQTDRSQKTASIETEED